MRDDYTRLHTTTPDAQAPVAFNECLSVPSHHLFLSALAARQVGKQVVDEGERVVVSRRRVKAQRLRRAAQPVTRWAVRHLTNVNRMERRGQDDGGQKR